MQRIKISVFLFFALFALAFYGYQFFTPTAIGQSVGTTLSAPTGVIASDGNYYNKVGIHWDTIRGATVYRIFRNTTNNTAAATDVGTTSANYFFDTTAVVNQNYFYWVKAENGSGASDFSNSDQGLRAEGMLVSESAPLEPPGAPAGNPVTAAKAYLGKTLFWDEQLSSTRTMACGTCHQAGTGGSDPRTIFGNAETRNPGYDMTFGTPDDVFGSRGVPKNSLDGTYSMSGIFGFNEQVTGRKSPSYLNSGYSPNGLFWDGRADDTFRDPITNAIILAGGASLESQVLGPPLSDVEMAHGGRDWNQVAAQISNSKPLALAANIPTALNTWIGGRTYQQLFEEVYGTADVTPAKIAMAIATHERTLFSDQTPWDKWAANIEPLTPEETMGRVFFAGLQCNACHTDALFTDHNFHNIGVRPPNEDTGRGSQTGNPDDNGKFKNPTLRNVELHAPYMHDGRFATLEEVVEFYNRGGDHDAPNIDRNLIRPLNLAPEEKAALVAFMKRPMTDPRVRDELPPFDRPTLYTQTTRVPTVSGTGRNGAGGFLPKVTAIEPPLVGNPSFTVAVSNGLGNAQAVLVIDSNDPGVGTSIPASGSFTRQTINLLGTGNGAGFGSISIAIPNNPALVGQTFFGRWYVTDASAANGFSVSQVFQFTVFGAGSSVPTGAAHVDFDGDRKTDISIFRPSSGEWWYQRSSDNQVPAFQFGAGTDKIVPADYTGDGKTDIAVWRPSTGEWFVLRSEDSSYYAFPFGANGDTPAPGDFDGDGKSDPTVFRSSNATWYTQASSQGVLIRQFGATGDIPQVGDYDGDGKADTAIFRPNGASGGEWWINRSASGLFAVQFGSSSDRPVAADYTGDGKMDLAFFRPSEGKWYVLRSEDSSYYAAPFGVSTDIPAPGDYDGDGETDFAVFRPSNATWYALRSTQGLLIVGFGINGDYPAPAAYIP